MKNREFITYGIIIVACIGVMILVASQDFGKNRTVHQMYLSSYPKHLDPGEDVSFSVTVENIASGPTQYVMELLVDGEQKKTRQITVSANSETLEEFTLEQNFASGESHRIETILYDENMRLDSYGSSEHPYYVFFKVDVV